MIVLTRSQQRPFQLVKRSHVHVVGVSGRLVPRTRCRFTQQDIEDIKGTLSQLVEGQRRLEKGQGSLGNVVGALVEGAVRHEESLPQALSETARLPKKLKQGRRWRQSALLTNLTHVAKQFNFDAAETARLASAVLVNDMGIIKVLEIVVANANEFAQVNQASSQAALQHSMEYKSRAAIITLLLEDLRKRPQDMNGAWGRLREGINKLQQSAVAFLKAQGRSEERNTTLQVLALAIKYCSTSQVPQPQDALARLLEQQEGLFVALACALGLDRLQTELQLNIAGSAVKVSANKYQVELAEVKAGAVADGIEQLWVRLHFSWWVVRNAGFAGTIVLYGRLLMVAGQLPQKQTRTFDNSTLAEITAHRIVL